MKYYVIGIGLFVWFSQSIGLAQAAPFKKDEIKHDAEHYILLKEHSKRWASEDKNNAKRLAQLRKQNGGKRPNIIYILIDDVGYGEFGIPELNYVRGYSTPSINKLASESLSLARMYTEPSCTPTRTAFLTGRIPVRSHMLEPKVAPPEGSGLHKDEITIAEVLRASLKNSSNMAK